MSEWDDLVRDFGRALRARNLSDNTVRIYTDAVKQLRRWLDLTEKHLSPVEVSRRDISAFMQHRLTERSAGIANNEFRSLQQWWLWLVDEEEIEQSPMLRLKAPIIPEKPVPVLTPQQLKDLLASIKGSTFLERRDTAIIRLLADTGGRLAEAANRKIEDADLDSQLLYVVAKGRRSRALPFGHKTSLAISRYLRVRSKEKKSEVEWLWLAERGRGRLGDGGFKQMLRRRGREIGLPKLHAHQFRHTTAHEWLSNRGNETDLMQLMGWKSPQMLRRYGASKAAERARDAHKKMGLGDQI